jgi:hypothetical protein
MDMYNTYEIAHSGSNRADANDLEDRPLLQSALPPIDSYSHVQLDKNRSKDALFIHNLSRINGQTIRAYTNDSK